MALNVFETAPVNRALVGVKRLRFRHPIGHLVSGPTFPYQQQVADSERRWPGLRVHHQEPPEFEKSAPTPAPAPVEANIPKEMAISEAAAEAGHLMVSHSMQPANDTKIGAEIFLG